MSAKMGRGVDDRHDYAEPHNRGRLAYWYADNRFHHHHLVGALAAPPPKAKIGRSHTLILNESFNLPSELISFLIYQVYFSSGTWTKI
jgi:hypothetical protein